MKTQISRKVVRMVLSLTALAFALGNIGHAQAKGGTAKPPTKNLTNPLITRSAPSIPNFTANAADIHGLDVTGFIQKMTVDASGCGGTVTVNNMMITIPCNTVVQMPANTFRWEEFVNFTNPGSMPAPTPDLTLASGRAAPSFEIQVVGNQVGDKLIAGLVFVSQQSVNSGAGYITKIDYETGILEVSVGGSTVYIQINDPNGRFGRPQSPDPRFSVDDANPTIHAGTGYPMCVPRFDPDTKDDPRCPAKNRPLNNTAGLCRDFIAAIAVNPASGPLAPTPANSKYCTQFVMPAPPEYAPKGALGGAGMGWIPAGYSAALPSSKIAGANDPDSREQAPFEVGDYIIWSGTLFPKGTDDVISGKTIPTPGDFISAHTIEASVGIYTQPGTQPSYLAIGEFGVGTADPAATAINGAAQETQDRIFLEASTTDITTPVDIFFLDVDPLSGLVKQRWLTPYEMTGECSTVLAPTTPTCMGQTGGITTQFAGPQPQRARIRAAKAPTGLLSYPSRNIRVMARSLCLTDPTVSLSPTLLEHATYTPALDACVNSKKTVANGLVAGQYSAPVFEYIFPENVQPGATIVPFDLWHLPHLIDGEGPGTQLNPTPW